MPATRSFPRLVAALALAVAAATAAAEHPVGAAVTIRAACRGVRDWAGLGAAAARALEASYNDVFQSTGVGGGGLSQVSYEWAPPSVPSSLHRGSLRTSSDAVGMFHGLWTCATCGGDDDAVGDDVAASFREVAPITAPGMILWAKEFAQQLAHEAHVSVEPDACWTQLEVDDSGRYPVAF